MNGIANGEATRALIKRALAAIEVELGEPIAWRLFHLMLAVDEFRHGRFETASALAARVLLPRHAIPDEEIEGLPAPALGRLRHEVSAL
ncbi:MAG TPA: hypothetical protein VIF14_04020 [Alphaproteobacteria bacterium]|jgi:hypothetical protein